MNNDTANDVLITAQWAVAAAANSIQMRALVVDVDFPPY
jgi:hypothetical protein